MQARRVDQHQLRPGTIDHAQNPVPCGLRLRGNDRHLAPDERIHQGGFADVGPPDNGDVTGAKFSFAHACTRISSGSKSMTFAAASCSARRRLAPSPTATMPNTGTSQVTLNDCAGGSPAAAVKV